MEVKSIICARCGDEVEDNGTKLCYQCLEKEEEGIDFDELEENYNQKSE